MAVFYEFGKKDGAAFTPEVSARGHEFRDDQYSLSTFRRLILPCLRGRSDKVSATAAVPWGGLTGTTERTQAFLCYDVSLRRSNTTSPDRGIR